jgi:predicted transcriptional regulator
MSISITIDQAGDFGVDEVRNAITDSLSRQAKQAVAQRDYYLKQCRAFEEQYGMDSDTFLAAFDAGQLGDDEDFFAWYSMKQIYDSWERRVQILAGASVRSE